MFRPLLIAIYVTSAISTTWSQTITPADASKHVGDRATVCGVIAGKHTAEQAKGKPTFVDLDGRYPHQLFTVVIWEDARGKVGKFPATGRVCVSGKIEDYKGTPQIVLRDERDWTTQPADVER